MENKKINKTKSKKATKKPIEYLFEKIEKIIEEMDDESCTLEKSLELYQKGIELIKEAKDSIDKIEKKIEILRED